MKKICIEAGHKGLTTGATGAPNERTWTTKFVPILATKLKALGYETYETNALAYNDTKVTGTDWDLYIACHYDADIYNDRGGFVDTPDQSVDYVSTESNRIAQIVRSVYFTKTGIPEKPQRSNANTKFYYQWSSLSANTPCVIIECGVGNRSPEDKITLFDKIDLVASSLAEGIHKALGVPLNDCETKLAEIQVVLDGVRDSRDKWKTKCEESDVEHTKDLKAKIKHIEELQKTVAELNAQLAVNSGGNQSNLDEIAKLRAELAVSKGELQPLKDTLEESKKENERLGALLIKCQDSQVEVTGFIAWLKKLLGGGA